MNYKTRSTADLTREIVFFFLLAISHTTFSLLYYDVTIQPQLQLVNVHRNRRYFVIKLHTWFCLSYFLKTNIKCNSIYQYFMSINSFFNTVSVYGNNDIKNANKS